MIRAWSISDSPLRLAVGWVKTTNPSTHEIVGSRCVWGAVQFFQPSLRRLGVSSMVRTAERPRCSPSWNHWLSRFSILPFQFFKSTMMIRSWVTTTRSISRSSRPRAAAHDQVRVAIPVVWKGGSDIADTDLLGELDALWVECLDLHERTWFATVDGIGLLLVPTLLCR